MNEWIPVSERLPTKKNCHKINNVQNVRLFQIFICTVKVGNHNKEIRALFFNLDTKVWTEQGCDFYDKWVVAWQPLPKPYVKDEDLIKEFIDIILKDTKFLQKHKIKEVYGYYGLREVWFVTNDLTSNTIMSFMDDIYDIEENYDDILTFFVGEDEVNNGNNISRADCKYEVNIPIGTSWKRDFVYSFINLPFVTRQSILETLELFIPEEDEGKKHSEMILDIIHRAETKQCVNELIKLVSNRYGNYTK